MNNAAFCKRFFLMLVVFLSMNSNAWALLIDLNTFSSQPGASVSISSDGLSAVFTEDIFLTPVSLSKSDLLVPDDAVNLSFDYELVVPLDNEDYFDFYLGNTGGPLFSVGGFADPFVETNTLVWSSTYNADLTAYAGSTVEIIFGFMYGWYDWGFDSQLTISNMQIVQKVTVPEPGTLLLLGLGILGIIGIRRLA